MHLGCSSGKRHGGLTQDLESAEKAHFSSYVRLSDLPMSFLQIGEVLHDFVDGEQHSLGTGCVDCSSGAYGFQKVIEIPHAEIGQGEQWVQQVVVVVVIR